MKHFLIKYRRETGTEAEWHKEIAKFIAALDTDPELAGRISYCCMNGGAAGYFHLATTLDDTAAKTLQTRAFFQHYTGMTKQVSNGTVEVVPLEVVAETKRTA